MQDSKLINWYETQIDKVAMLCFLLPILSVYTFSFDFFISVALSYTLLRLGYQAFAIQLAAFVAAKVLLTFYGVSVLGELLVVSAVLLSTLTLKVTRSMTSAAVVTTVAALGIVGVLHYFVPADEIYWEQTMRQVIISLPEGSSAPEMEDIGVIAAHMSALNAFLVVCVGVITSYMASILALRVAKVSATEHQYDILPNVFPLVLLLGTTIGVWANIDGMMQLLIVAMAPFVLSGIVYSWRFLSEKSPAPILFKIMYIILFVLAAQVMGMFMLLIGLIRSIFQCGEKWLNLKK
ncbi:hypothetical protein OAT84_01560 [Gammaproteobacteria bacterium]|nr:hypothetical protein [Gammaproteobacteria bacterium]